MNSSLIIGTFCAISIASIDTAEASIEQRALSDWQIFMRAGNAGVEFASGRSPFPENSFLIAKQSAMGIARKKRIACEALKKKGLTGEQVRAERNKKDEQAGIRQGSRNNRLKAAAPKDCK